MFGLKLPSQLKKGAAEEEHSRKKAAGEVLDVVDRDAHLAWKRNRGGPVWGVKSGNSTQANPSSPPDSSKARAGWNVPPPPPTLNISEDSKVAPENPPTQAARPAWGGAGLVSKVPPKVEEKKTEPTWADMSDDEEGPLVDIPIRIPDVRSNEDVAKMINDRSNSAAPLSQEKAESPRRICGCGMHTNPDHKCDGKPAAITEGPAQLNSSETEGEPGKGEEGNPTTPRTAGALGNGRFGGNAKREDMRRDGEAEGRREEWRKRDEAQREDVRRDDRWRDDRREDRWREDGAQHEEDGRVAGNWRERREPLPSSTSREVAAAAAMPTPTMILKRPASTDASKKTPPPSPQAQQPSSPAIAARDQAAPAHASEPGSPSKRPAVAPPREPEKTRVDHTEASRRPAPPADAESSDDGKEHKQPAPVKILSRPQTQPAPPSPPAEAPAPHLAVEEHTLPQVEKVQAVAPEPAPGMYAPVDMAALSLSEGDASRVYVVPVMASVLPVDPAGMGVHGAPMMVHPGHVHAAGTHPQEGQQQGNQQLFAQQYQQMQLQAEYMARQQQQQSMSGEQAQQRLHVVPPQVYLVQGHPHHQPPPPHMDHIHPMMPQLSPAQQAQLLMLSPAQQQELQRQVRLQAQMQAPQHHDDTSRQEPPALSAQQQQQQQQRLLDRQRQHAPDGSARPQPPAPQRSQPQQRPGPTQQAGRGPSHAATVHAQPLPQASRTVVQAQRTVQHLQASSYHQQQQQQHQYQQQPRPHVQRQPPPAARGGHHLNKPRPFAQPQHPHPQRHQPPQQTTPRQGPGPRPASGPAQSAETNLKPVAAEPQPVPSATALQQRAKPGPREPYVHPRARQPEAQKEDAPSSLLPVQGGSESAPTGKKGPKTPRAAQPADQPTTKTGPALKHPPASATDANNTETAGVEAASSLTPRDRGVRRGTGRGMRPRGRGGHMG